MGMYDTISIPLEVYYDKISTEEREWIKENNPEFQTKDLECYCFHYEVDSEQYVIIHLDSGMKIDGTGCMKCIAKLKEGYLELLFYIVKGEIKDIQRL